MVRLAAGRRIVVLLMLLAILGGHTVFTLAYATGPIVLGSDSRSSDADFVIGAHGSKFYVLNQKTRKSDYSSDATTVIQKALSTVASAGGKVFITAGTYPVTRIVVTGTNVTLESEFAVLIASDKGISTRRFSSSIQKSDGTQTLEVLDSAPVVLVDRATDVRLRRIVIDGNPLSRAFHRDGILIWDSRLVLVEKCEIRNVEGSAIRTRSSGTYDLANAQNSSLKTTDVVVKESSVRNTRTNVGPPIVKGFGYEIEFSDKVTIESSVAENCAESMFRSHYSRHVNFLNNIGSTILRVTSGEVFDLYRSDYVVVKGNRMFDPKGLGIYIYEYSTNLLVESNEIRSLSPESAQVRLEGIGKYRSAPIENIIFRNNSISGTVQLSNSYLRNVRFEGNTLYSLRAWPAEETPRVLEGIYFVSNNFTARNVQAGIVSIPIAIINSTFFNRVEVRESTTGIVVFEGNEFTSDGFAYSTGIYIAGSVEYVKVTHNYFHDVTYQAVFVSVDVGLSQNGLIEIVGNRFKNNGFAGPQDTIVLKTSSVIKIMITNNQFESTPGSFTMYLSNADGTVADNVMDKPIWWQPPSALA